MVRFTDHVAIYEWPRFPLRPARGKRSCPAPLPMKLFFGGGRSAVPAPDFIGSGLREVHVSETSEGDVSSSCMPRGGTSLVRFLRPFFLGGNPCVTDLSRDPRKLKMSNQI